MNAIARLGVLCCAGLIGLTSPAVRAQTTGYAEILNVKVSLIDLDPGDGIQPWIDFGSNPAFAFANIYPTNAGDGQWLYVEAGKGSMATFGRGGALATSTIVAGALLGPGAGPSGYATASSAADLIAHAHTSVLETFAFQLSPMTALQITADSVSMSLPAAGSVTDYNIGARVLIHVGSVQSWSGIFAVPSWQSASQASHLQALYENRSTSTVNGIADAMAYAYVGAVAAVPEVSTFAALLAGLAVVAGVVRRKRQNRA